MRPITPKPTSAPIALLAALAIAGCSTMPGERPTAAPLPAGWDAAEIKSTPETLVGWWTGFQDPLLNRLIEEGVANGGGPRQAMLRVKEARANNTLAIAPFLPQVFAVASADGQRLVDGASFGNRSGVGGGFTAQSSGREQATSALGARISWEIPLYGRIEASIAGVGANEALAQSDLDGARAALAADIADAYVSLRAAQNRKLALQDSVAAADELARLLEISAQAGLVAPADAADARRQAETIRAQAPDLDIALAQSRNALAILRGRAPGADEADIVQALAALGPTPSLALTAAPAAPADLVRLRPDVRQAEARALAAAASLAAARSDLFPRISLGGAILVNDNISGDSLPGRITVASVSPSISIPLLDWGQRFATADINDARFQQSLLAYRDTVNAGVGEAQLALTQLSQGAARLSAAQRAEEAAAITARGVRASQEAGIASVADRLRADSQLIDARLRRIGAEESQARAAIAVYRAFGGGPPPLPIASVK